MHTLLASILGLLAVAAPTYSQTLYDLRPGPGESYVEELVALDGEMLLFVANADAIPGPELMRWTPSLGVEFVTQIGVQSNPPFGDPKFVEYQQLTPAWVDGRRLVFFSGNDGETGREPWVTDGTAAGTLRLADLVSSDSSSYPVEFTESGGRMYFAATPDLYSYNLYVSDGTPAGTQNLLGSLPSGKLADSVSFAALGDELVFAFQPWFESWKLWKTDGTVLGTQPWLEFPAGFADMSPSELFAFDGGVVMLGRTPAMGYELFFGRADGTLIGWDLNPGSAHSLPRYFMEHAGELFFVADDGSHGQELWKLASGAAAPELVADLVPGPTSSAVRGLISADDGLYFTVTGAATGVGLWRSQGVPGDPVAVPDLTPAPGITNPRTIARLGGGVLLKAETAGVGAQPYLATAAGIVPVPGWDSSVALVMQYVASKPLERLIGGHMVLRAYTASSGEEFAVFDHDGALSSALDVTVSGIGLSTNDPLLGKPIDVHIDDVPASMLGGVLVLSGPAPVQSLPGFAPDNGVVVNPNAYQIAKLFPAGTSHAMSSAIPASPGLIGAAFHLQAVFLQPDFVTFASSNAVRLELGT